MDIDRRVAGVLGCCVLLAACGGSEPAPRSASETSPARPEPRTSATPAATPPPCSGAQCLEPGVAALASGDKDARALLGRACDAGSVEGCLELGKAYAAGRGGPADLSKAREAFDKTCAGGGYHADGCAFWIKASHDADEKVDVPVAAKASSVACVLPGANDTNREARALSCLIYAQVLRATKGDEDGAVRALGYACKLGSDIGCNAQKRAEAAAKATQREGDVEGANINVESMKVDGLVLTDIACRTEDSGLGGLFGSMALGAGFKSRRTQLDACSLKASAETRVRWTGAGGRMTNIHATGKDPTVSKCVERALDGAMSTTSGTCAATVKHGRR